MDDRLPTRLRVVEHHLSGERELGEYRFAVPPRPGDGFSVHGATAGGWEHRYVVARTEHRFDAGAPDEPATVVVVRRALDALFR